MISYNPIFKRLNKYFLPGEVYLLTSSENSGRTTLADNIVIEFLKNDIAARILYFDGSYKEFSKLSKISENTKDIKAKDMILDSIKSHKIIVKSAKKLIESASKSKDDVTVDLAIRRKEFHEKSIWMLKSLIE